MHASTSHTHTHTHTHTSLQEQCGCDSLGQWPNQVGNQCCSSSVPSDCVSRVNVDSHPPQHAVDASAGTYWQSSTSSSLVTLTVSLQMLMEVVRIAVTFGVNQPRAMILQHSVDGVTWLPLQVRGVVCVCVCVSVSVCVCVCVCVCSFFELCSITLKIARFLEWTTMGTQLHQYNKLRSFIHACMHTYIHRCSNKMCDTCDLLGN